MESSEIFQIYIKFQGTFGSHVGLIGGHFELLVAVAMILLVDDNREFQVLDIFRDGLLNMVKNSLTTYLLLRVV